MWSEIFKDSKTLTSAGAVVIALALIWLVNSRWEANEQALRLNAQAISENTAVVKQFQSLLLELQRDPRLRSSLLNGIVDSRELAPINN